MQSPETRGPHLHRLAGLTCSRCQHRQEAQVEIDVVLKLTGQRKLLPPTQCDTALLLEEGDRLLAEGVHGIGMRRRHVPRPHRLLGDALAEAVEPGSVIPYRAINPEPHRLRYLKRDLLQMTLHVLAQPAALLVAAGLAGG